MAYTKILVIHNRLDKCVGYTQDPEKTSLEAAIDYALDREKTEQTCFETAINCDRESVYADMMDTKRRWGKEGRKRKGYHIIQSFAPGEVTPDQAHAVGVEFARRLLGDRYEAIVSTHLNKAHLHSHIVFNSISFVDGAMYRDQLKDYYGGDGVGIRGTSDAICREHGLSIIEPSEPLGGPVSRAEWEAARQGKATVRDLIRRDVHLPVLPQPTAADGVSGKNRPQGQAHRYPSPRWERVYPSGQPERRLYRGGHTGPACRRPFRRGPAGHSPHYSFLSAGAGPPVSGAGWDAPPPKETHGLSSPLLPIPLPAGGIPETPSGKPGGVFHAGGAAETGPLSRAIPLSP